MSEIKFHHNLAIGCSDIISLSHDHNVKKIDMQHNDLYQVIRVVSVKPPPSIRNTFGIPEKISDQELQETAKTIAETPSQARAAVLKQSRIGRWATENGVGIAQLVVALVQLAMQIRG